MRQLQCVVAVHLSFRAADPSGEGLIFITFAMTLSPILVQLRRVVGVDDGVVDALFRFTRLTATSSFFCPPVAADGRIDLRAILG